MSDGEPALEPDESNRVLRYLFNDLAAHLSRCEARQNEHVMQAVTVLKSLKPDAAMQAPRPIPVTAHLAAATKAAEGQRAWRLAPNVRGLRRALQWVQNANYSGKPGFLRSYGYSLVAGPGGLMESDALALGFLLLAPGFHYPAHVHPAVELYVPLTGPAQWYRQGDGW
ncbi:MAG: dimethylsulfonioproprionate lyase family protein, partial [Alphaproteobacteria bacterium]